MTSYTGRHRPSPRAEHRAQERRPLPKRLKAPYVLPGAAVVALGLTAAGATVAQHSPFAMTEPKGVAASLPTDRASDEGASSGHESGTRDTATSTWRRSDAAAADQERERAQRSTQRRERADDWAAAQQARRQEQAAKEEQEDSEDDWVKPVEDAVFSSPFGERDGRLHAGQDYATPIGTPLKAMGDGEVIAGGPMSGYGTYIDVEYTDGSVSRYGHLDSLDASIGDEVDAGDVVAHSGNTGDSTGPHLHLEIHPDGDDPIDPAGWLAERGID